MRARKCMATNNIFLYSIMSQSDYIKYKKVANELKNLGECGSVLESGKYTDFKNFQLENTILDTNIMYSKLLPPNYVSVFGIAKNPATCGVAQFPLCNSTNLRENRVPMRVAKMSLCLNRPLALKTAKAICPMRFDVRGTEYCLRKEGLVPLQPFIPE